MEKLLRFLLLGLILILFAVGGGFLVSYLNGQSPKVVLRSDLSGYKISGSENFTRFEKYLSDIGFWKTAGVLNTKADSAITVKKLNLVLTSIPQESLPFYEDPSKKVLISSVGYSTAGDEATISIQIDIPKSKNAGIDPNETFSLYAMQMANFALNDKESRTVEYFDAVSKRVESSYAGPFVDITP